METLDRYRFSGHSCLMGVMENSWQATDEVLTYFGGERRSASRRYRAFVEQGIALGRQPELVGGGLIRSAGGWGSVRSVRKAGIFQKSDERILGDGDFVNSVLAEAREAKNKRYLLASRGFRMDDILPVVEDLLSVDRELLIGPSKERGVVKARAILCYWSVYELGVTMTDVARYLKIAVPTVSVAAKNGRQIVREKEIDLIKLLNI